VSARVLLLIALLAPVVIIAAGIASRWRDPAGSQNGARENSNAPATDLELIEHRDTPRRDHVATAAD
jgi:hypothetical protein